MKYKSPGELNGKKERHPDMAWLGLNNTYIKSREFEVEIEPNRLSGLVVRYHKEEPGKEWEGKVTINAGPDKLPGGKTATEIFETMAAEQMSYYLEFVQAIKVATIKIEMKDNNNQLYVQGIRVMCEGWCLNI